MKKLRHRLPPEEAAIARNKFLLKTRGISLDEYNARFAEQGGVCKVCGRPPKEGGRPLHVEHDHKVAASKITVKLVVSTIWHAFVPAFNVDFEGPTKETAHALAKTWLLRKSIRGLVCWFCNEGIKRFRDDPGIMRAAAGYIDTYQDGLHVAVQDAEAPQGSAHGPSQIHG